MIRLYAPCPALDFRMLSIRSVVVCLLVLLAILFHKGEAIVKADTDTGVSPAAVVAPFEIPICDYYASPLGSPSGNGTLLNPWSLQTALNKSTVIVAGKTLCLQGGTYRGKFESTLNGGTVRAAANEYPIIDGYVFTGLSQDIDSLQTTFRVADASIFVTAWRAGSVNSLIVDGEALFINDISGNTISVNRAAAGSSTAALSHTAGTPVRLAGNQLLVTGSNTVYRDIEIMNSDPLRNWNTDGAEGLRGAGVTNVGNGNKFVNLNVHDNLIGIFCSSASSNSELTGNVIYNNGMFTDTDKGAGHGLYLENASGYSRVYDNIVLNNFALGAQLYGRTAAYPGGDIQGNVLANSGSPLGYDLRHYNLLVGTETQRITDILIQNNYLFHPHSFNAYNVHFGYGSGVDNGRILKNFFVGGQNVGLELTDVANVTVSENKFYSVGSVGINIQSSELPYTIDNNTYYATAANAYKFGNVTNHLNQTFAQWKSSTGFDAVSTINAAALPDTVIVRPNTYLSGRANITVYISSNSPSINVNLSTAGLMNGQPFTIRNAFNYSGAAVAAGVYNAASPTISLPLGGASATVAMPVGSTYTPPTTLPQFGAFVVIPSSVPGTPTPTNTPTATFTPTPTFTPTITPTFTPTFTPTATPVSFVNGTVTYGNAVGSSTPRTVSNVLISGVGSPPSFALSTFPNGTYSLGVGIGSYIVTPSKTGGQNGAINSFDAARIAQFVTGHTTFTGVQQLAADVSGNGSVNSFDAAQIARYTINSSPFGSAGTWRFSPVNRNYLMASSNIADEDYSAVLMGEVSGNWANTGARPVNLDGPGKSIAVTAPELVTSAGNEAIVQIGVDGIADKGIISYEFDLRYDPAVIQPNADAVDVAGTVSRGLHTVFNSDEPGILRVAVYGPMPIDGNGVLLRLRFITIGEPGSSSPLIWERILLNEGDLQVSSANGNVEILPSGLPVD